jgi:endonuclease/exonuclease/phosphatase family metal-dependent hydrolase
MIDKKQNLPRSLAAALRRRAPRSFQSDDGDACTTIASYNVHKCVGTDGKFDPVRTAAVIAELDADIVALQEIDERLGERVGLLDLKALTAKTGLEPVLTPKNSRSHGWHGNMILARSSTVHEVKPIRLPGLEPRGALIVDLELKGVPLRVIATHFGLLRASRSLQASTLVEAASSVIRPTIILGDLNEWRVRTRSSLLTMLPHFGPLNAALPSFPSGFPLLALDRILARPANLISSLEVHQSELSRVASDHLPLKARLKLGGQRQAGSDLDAA